MARVAAFETRHPPRGGAARLSWSISRAAIGVILFLFVAFFLLAAGAVTGAPQGGGAPVETGAFVLDPSIGSARG